MAPVTGFTTTAIVLRNMSAQAQAVGTAWLLIGMVALAALKWRNSKAMPPI